MSGPYRFPATRRPSSAGGADEVGYALADLTVGDGGDHGDS